MVRFTGGRSRLFVSLSVVVSSLIAVPAGAQAASRDEIVDFGSDSASRYVILSANEKDWLSLKADFENADAVVQEEFGSVISGGVVLMTERQVADVRTDPRVNRISADNIVMTDAEESLDGSVVPGQFIVRLKTSSSVATMENIVGAYGDKMTHLYRSAFNGFAAELSSSDVKVLKRNPAVESVTPDRYVKVDGEQSNPTWGLDRIDQVNLPLNARYSYSGTGANVDVYVIDSGVQSNHPDFGGRVASGYPTLGSNDCDGHGTHVAGTVASTTYGVAKSARIIPVRVLDCSGSGSYAGIIAGIDWVVSHHSSGVKAIANMSLGGPADPNLNSAVGRLLSDGIVPVSAAGNESVSACSKSPASASATITVGATDRNDFRAGFSNYGSCLDLFAPGVDIVSTMMGSTSGSLSGTSMAAPHVAGAAAVYWSLNPSFSAASVMSGLLNLASSGKVFSPGTGSPNKLLYMTPASGVVPGTPAAPVATQSNGTVGITWTAPSSTGTSAINAYTVQTSAGSTVCSWTSGPLSCSVSGLASGTYSFKVSASSNAGASPWSALSNSVTVTTTGNNDFFASARSISGTSGSINDSNTSATREVGEPQPYGSAATKWYSYSAPTSGTMSINTDGSNFDTVLAVYSGSSVSTLTTLASDDDSGSEAQSALTVSVSQGSTYFVQVGGYTSSHVGSIVLTWSLSGSTCSGTPSNNSFSCATTLSTASGTSNTSNSLATTEAGEPSQYNSGRSIWYRFSPTGSGTGLFDLYLSDFDTVLEVYRSSSASPSFSNLVAVASNDDFSDSDMTSYLPSVTISAGYHYFVRVAGYNSSSGSVRFYWNLSLTSPATVPGAPTSVQVTGGAGSVSLTWSPPVSDGGSPITTYTATSSPAGFSCNTSATSCTIAGLQNFVSYTFTVSARNVVGWGAASTPSSPVTLGYSNDAISAALGISDGDTFSNNSLATSETSEPVHAGLGGGKSMWFRYSSTSLRTVNLSTGGSDFDTVLAVYRSGQAQGASGSVYGEVWESQTLALSAPAGSVFTRVSFASYGNPSGSGGNYSLGSCHSASSANAVANAFVGRSSGSISADNGVFGDPCPGTFKNLRVRLEYGPSTSVTMTSLVEVVSNDDAPGLNGGSEVSFVAEPNVVYYIAVDGYEVNGVTASGRIQLQNVTSALVRPSSPQNVVAAPGIGSISVAWRKPAVGGSTVTSYRATASPGGQYCEPDAGLLRCVISGLSSSVSYSVTVTATNLAGTSDPSIPVSGNTPTTAQPTLSLAHTWGIDRVDQRTNAPDGYISIAGRGQGVRIYVVDTGVRTTHQEFTGRIAQGYSAVSDGFGVSDCNGHGTHVASTAAGTSYGIATSATVVPVRVLDCDGSGSTSDVVAGLNWIANQMASGRHRAVVNMSLGGMADSVIDAAVNSLISAGVTVVVAAGNDSRDACNYSPARVSAAITVGSSTDADIQSSFSNTGSCVDLFAPGSGILGAGITSNSSTDTLSGTSMASPHVAGYAAAVLGLFGSDGAPLAPAQVVAAIVGTSTANVLTGVSNGTSNKLMYVGADRCTVASAAGVNCAQSSTPPSTTIAPVTNTPSITVPAGSTSPVAPSTLSPTTLRGSSSVASVVKAVKVTVPSGYRAALVVKKQAACKLSGGKLVVLKTGTCSVVVQLRSPGRKTKVYNKTVRVKK